MTVLNFLIICAWWAFCFYVGWNLNDWIKAYYAKPGRVKPCTRCKFMINDFGDYYSCDYKRISPNSFRMDRTIISLVTGESTFKYNGRVPCNIARLMGEPCGIRGSLFEEKVVEEEE